MSVPAFLDHLQHERRYSLHTVSAYARDLRQFAAHLLEHGAKDNIDQAVSIEIRTWLMRLMEKGLSARSVRRKLSSLRSYFRFALEASVVKEDPCDGIDSPKMAQRLPAFIAEEGMADLLEKIDFPPGYRGVFDRLLIEILYGTGIRLAELVNMKVHDVDFHTQSLRVVGKRNKERQIPLSLNLANQFKTYLTVRKDEGSDIMLISERGKPASRSLVQRRVGAYLGKVTTQSKKSPHVLRHTFATHLLNNGADLNAVKEILGHADLTATQVYTHNTIDKLKRVHAQAHPRGTND